MAIGPLDAYLSNAPLHRTSLVAVRPATRQDGRCVRLTLLGPQSRSGDKLLRNCVDCPLNGTAVLEGSSFVLGKPWSVKCCIRYLPGSYVLRCLTATDSLLLLCRLYKGCTCRGNREFFFRLVQLVGLNFFLDTLLYFRDRQVFPVSRLSGNLTRQ